MVACQRRPTKCREIGRVCAGSQKPVQRSRRACGSRLTRRGRATVLGTPGLNKEHQMSRKSLRSSVILFAVTLAISALAMPAVASASQWSPFNLHSTLDSPAISFTTTTGFGWTCTDSQLTTDVRSIDELKISSASFGSCHGTGSASSCATTQTATDLPWTAIPVSTTDVLIADMKLDVTFSGPFCGGVSLLVTGLLRGGVWTNGTSREVTYDTSPGLAAHSALLGSNIGLTVSGTIRSTNSSLAVRHTGEC